MDTTSTTTAHSDKANIDDALRRADALLVTSLKGEEAKRRRKRIRAMAGTCLLLVCAIGLYWVARFAYRSFKTSMVSDEMPRPSARQLDRVASALSSQDPHDWRDAFAAGQKLAEADPEDGFARLRQAWPQVTSSGARQQLLKAFAFVPEHPHLLDVMDLGMNDTDPKVREWAVFYLRQIAFQDFGGESAKYAQWRQKTVGRPLADVSAEAAREWIDRLRTADAAQLHRDAAATRDAARGLHDSAAARQAAIDAGALDLAIGWLSERADDEESVRNAGEILTDLAPDETWLREHVLPLTDKARPIGVRCAAVSILGRKGNVWAVDALLGVLNDAMTLGRARTTLVWGTATALGEIGDARAIPTMINVIARDNTYDTIYGVGYFGLRLTGVPYDESHDGAWWRDWWLRERDSLNLPTEVRSQQIAEPAPKK